jgi:hypothetical protein
MLYCRDIYPQVIWAILNYKILNPEIMSAVSKLNFLYVITKGFYFISIYQRNRLWRAFYRAELKERRFMLASKFIGTIPVRWI